MLKSDCEAGAFCYHKMPLPDKFRTVERPEKIRGEGGVLKVLLLLLSKTGKGGGLEYMPTRPPVPAALLCYEIYSTWRLGIRVVDE